MLLFVELQNNTRKLAWILSEPRRFPIKVRIYEQAEF